MGELWWWSWLLTAVGIVGLFLAGSKRKVGWAIGLGAQLLWIAYAIVSGQYGFLASAGAYGFVYARNWLRWRREQRALLNDPEAMAIDARRRPAAIPGEGESNA